MSAVPQMTAQEARAHQTFAALLQACSYPGRAYPLPGTGGTALLAVAAALLDLETSLYTPDAALAEQLAHLGARSRPPQHALYHFYPRLAADHLAALRTAPVGSHTRPDESATLMIGCLAAADAPAVHLRLEGPGIPPGTAPTIKVGGIPGAFWALRDEIIAYPLGWDIFLLRPDPADATSSQIIGLPRTTRVEVEAEVAFRTTDPTGGR